MRGVSMERSKVGSKKSPDDLSLPNQNKIICIRNLLVFYRWKKFNEIQLKNKMNLNNLKREYHAGSPVGNELEQSQKGISCRIP